MNGRAKESLNEERNRETEMRAREGERLDEIQKRSRKSEREKAEAEGESVNDLACCATDHPYLESNDRFSSFASS